VSVSYHFAWYKIRLTRLYNVQSGNVITGTT
jgi:hypothetical protein